MLAMILAGALALVTPQVDPAAWLDDGVDASRPSAVKFTGEVELTPADAFDSARACAEDGVRERLESEARALADAASPAWLPNFVAELEVRRWAEHELRHRSLEILDRRDVVRDHGFGKSFQTHLLVERYEPSARDRGGLQHRLRRAGQLFLAKCGGTLALWGALVVLFWWLDRLSRGYMSWRLRFAAIVVGLVVPGVAFLAI